MKKIVLTSNEYFRVLSLKKQANLAIHPLEVKICRTEINLILSHAKSRTKNYNKKIKINFDD